MSDSSDANLLQIFWVEVGDYLTSLNSALLLIETSTAPDSAALLREMNRVAHSMKGAAHAVGIGLIETVAHYMEEIFEAAYKGGLELTPDRCDLLYDGLDLIQNVVDGVENSTEALATTLARMEQSVASLPDSHTPRSPLAAQPQPAASQSPPLHHQDEGKKEEGIRRAKTTTGTHPAVRLTTETHEAGGTLQLRPAEENIRVPVSKLDRLMGEVSELLIARMHGEERARELGTLGKTHHRWRRDWRRVRTAYIRLTRRLQSQGAVDDELAALLAFLDINQRYLTEANRQIAALTNGLMQHNSQIGMLAEQLQDDIGGMRLMPFETILGGFQRMARDMARDTGKSIHLDVNGAAVEIDKTALDTLKDPIMHLLRNAVDHGIELPHERERLGKAATGRIELAVEQRGKEIVIRVADDGRGLDAGRISQAAVEAGILTQAEALNLTEEDAYSLIFQPGLTTSEQVTALSGRGLGMDIVRTRVESLRGRVNVRSTPGLGTTFTLRFPVSLSRMSCILLRLGEQDFAVPSIAVGRMLSLPRAAMFTAEGREMVMIDEQPMPLLPLSSLLNVPADRHEDDDYTLMVLSIGERSVAFEVDELYSEQELVLKPLGPEIAEAPFVSGAALLGTGEILIVLDANDLLRGGSGLARTLRPARRTLEMQAVEATPRKVRVLIADDSITTRTLEKHILETAGFEVHVAIDGAEAWDKIGEIKFDVLIADVEMPNMDGLELTRRVKTTESTKNVSVILLTSQA